MTEKLVAMVTHRCEYRVFIIRWIDALDWKIRCFSPVLYIFYYMTTLVIHPHSIFIGVLTTESHII